MQLETPVLIWWTSLSAIAVLNLGLLGWSARVVLGRDWPDAFEARYRRLQLFFGGLYVVGCASRSFVIRSDVNRYNMIDHVFASTFVGRSIATVAEVAFVVQWALLLHALSRAPEHHVGRLLAWPLVPLIVVAEICSWYAALTTWSLASAMEESLWTATAALFMVGLATHLKSAGPELKRFLLAALTAGAGYLAYMVTLDVPMYLRKWQRAEAEGKVYLTLSEGLQDTLTWTTTGSWEMWKGDVLWQSLYFSLAVWMSLTLIHRPSLRSPDRGP